MFNVQRDAVRNDAMEMLFHHFTRARVNGNNKIIFTEMQTTHGPIVYGRKRYLSALAL